MLGGEGVKGRPRSPFGHASLKVKTSNDKAKLNNVQGALPLLEALPLFKGNKLPSPLPLPATNLLKSMFTRDYP